MKGWRDKPLVLEKTCPKCGKHLVSRDGKYGEFLGCLGYPACTYTERGADTEYIYQPPSPYCEKCNHTGLIPFKNKEGKLIPYAFVYCECHKDEPEQRPILPRDFDFAMSYSNYRSLCQEHSWTDPGDNEIHKELQQELSPKEQEPEWGKKQWDSVLQVKAQVLHLQNRIDTLSNKKRKDRSPF